MILQFGDYRPDISNYDTTPTAFAQNVFPRGDGYGPALSFAAFSSALPGMSRGFFYARNADGTILVLAGTSTQLWRLDNTTLTWVSLGTFTALPLNFHWQFAQFGGFVVAVQPNVPPQVLTLATPTAFSPLAGSPPPAAYVTVVNRFLILSGLTAFPFRVQWPDIGNITNWTPGGGSVAGSQDFPEGGIARGVAGGEYGVLFQDQVVRRMIYSPGSTTTFQFEKVTDDLGLLAPYSIIRAGARVFFLAQQGFHVMDQTGIPQPIGKEKFDRTFFDDYDQSSMQLVVGAADPESTRVMWQYRSGGGAAGMADKILVYDRALDRAATLVNQASQYIASLAAPGITLEGLDAISSSIDALPFSLDDVALAALPKLATFNSANRLGFFSGATLEAIIDTAEQALDNDYRVTVRGLRPITNAPGCFASVGARENPQSPVLYSTEQRVLPAGYSPANVSTRLARARLRIPAGTVWTFATGVEPDFVRAGKY